MRRRLLVSIVGLLAAVLLLLAVPLALVLQRLEVDRGLDQLQAEVSQVGFVVENEGRTIARQAEILRIGARQAGLVLALFDVEGRERVRAVRADDVVEPGDTLSVARRRSVAKAREDGLLKVTLLVSSPGGQGTNLLLYGQRADADVQGRVQRAWLALGAILLAVLGIGVVAATVLGARFGRPLDRLAAAARRLGDGDFTSRAPRSGLEEVDAIGEALDATADRLGGALGRSQAFTADASHQLRTPLTALRLHLETAETLLPPADVEAPDATAGPVGAAARSVTDAIGEVDRLEATIAELVSLTELGDAAGPVDVRAVAEERLGAVRTRALAGGRELVLRAARAVPPVLARRGAVGQALDVLLDNALEHGSGRVTVVVGPAATGVRVGVHDEGTSMPADVAARVNSGEGRDRATRPARVALPLRGGRGLPLARALVEAEGGRLRVDREGGDVGPGTLVSLLLPARPAATDG